MKSCPICKKEFDKKGTCHPAKFCSKLCKEKNRQKKYLQYRDVKCGNCGFVAIHMCQLDVDHIDGNKKNNNPTNLQTLCANCHRLKTFINKDWQIKY